MPTYEREGLRLHYDVVGNGPSVLCVHSASSTAAFDWSALAAHLEPSYRVLLPDLRGHGLSDHRAGAISIENVDDDLRELIALECRTPPHVVAFSFGSEAALALELTYPGTCASLVLLSPGLGDPKSSVPTREQLVKGWPRSLRQLHAERHGEDHWLDLMVEMCERAALRPKADLGALAMIHCPVLLVVGQNDDPRRLRQAQVMIDAVPRCRLVVIEGARHAVHKDAPADVYTAIDGFLDGVASELAEPRGS